MRSAKIFCIVLASLVSIGIIGCGGGSSDQALPATTPNPAPSISPPKVGSFTATPSSIVRGDTTTLTWTTTNADRVAIDNGIGDQPPNGSLQVKPTADTTYSLAATGTGGQANASTSVQVRPPGAAVTLNVSPGSILFGESATLSWSAINVTSLTISPAPSGAPSPLPLSGSLTVSPSKTTTYQLDATGIDGSSASTQAQLSVKLRHFDGLYTYKNDTSRTGANTDENLLIPSTVNSKTFGKLFTFSVDEHVFTQPLYVPGLTINGTQRNVIFVATEHNSVYAFDADGKTLSPLWKRSFIDPAAGITPVPTGDVGSTIVPEIGITGTPVIDSASQTLYVVALTKENGAYEQRLHALDLATGGEKFGGPVSIRASVQGTGDGVDANGDIAFQAKIQLQRPALLLSNGTVYIAWASHGDNGPYHGWVMGYDAQTLARVMVHNNTPNGRRGGIWQSGGGLAADTAGNIYYISGNGSFSANSKSYGDSFVKLNTDGSVADFFTPFDQANLNTNDLDLGVGGPLLLPDQPGDHPHLITAAGKDATVYLIDRDDMGKFQASSNSQIVQSIPGVLGDHCHMQPVYWNKRVYFASENQPIRAFRLSNGKFITTPESQTTVIFEGGDNVGTNPSISSSGNSNGILWATERTNTTAVAILHAFDADDLSKELYNSTQAGTRDALGAHNKYTPPTVANGKVYVALNGSVAVFGLLP